MDSWRVSSGDHRGMTPLMFAAHGGHSSVMRILLNRGADFSIAMDGGYTALHLATQRNLAVTVDLVRAGADHT